MESNQMNFYNNDFVNHNKEIVEKFRWFDVERRAAFNKLRDELSGMAYERRKYKEDERREKLLEERDRWERHREKRSQLERLVTKI